MFTSKAQFDWVIDLYIDIAYAEIFEIVITKVPSAVFLVIAVSLFGIIAI